MDAQLSDCAQSVDSGHKSRTRRKRRLKQAILADIQSNFAVHVAGEAEPAYLPIAAE